MKTNSSLPARILGVHEKYERYEAFCRLLRVAPASFDVWQKLTAYIPENNYQNLVR